MSVPFLHDRVYRLKQHPLANDSSRNIANARKNPRQSDSMVLSSTGYHNPHPPKKVLEQLQATNGKEKNAPVRPLKVKAKGKHRNSASGKKPNVSLHKIHEKNASARLNRRVLNLKQPMKTNHGKLAFEMHGNKQKYVEFKTPLTNTGRMHKRYRRSSVNAATSQAPSDTKEPVVDQDEDPPEEKKEEGQEIVPDVDNEVPNEEENIEIDPLFVVSSDSADNVTKLEEILEKVDSNDMVNYVNKVSEQLKMTPLMTAAKNGNAQIVNRLLDKQADLNWCTEDGNSSLHVACQNSHCQVISVLIRSQAKLDIQNHDNKMFYELLHGDIISKLDVANLISDLIKTISPDKPFDSLEKFRVELEREVSEMYNKHSSKDTKCLLPDDALVIACKNGHIKDIQSMIDEYEVPEEASKMLNQVDHHGTPLLLLPIWRNHIPVVELFLDHGVDKKAVDIFGNSALHVACERGCMPIVATLLKHGASGELENAKGQSSYEMFRGSDKDILTRCAEFETHLTDNSFTKEGLGKFMEFKKNHQPEEDHQKEPENKTSEENKVNNGEDHVDEPGNKKADKPYSKEQETPVETSADDVTELNKSTENDETENAEAFTNEELKLTQEDEKDDSAKGEENDVVQTGEEENKEKSVGEGVVDTTFDKTEAIDKSIESVSDSENKTEDKDEKTANDDVEKNDENAEISKSPIDERKEEQVKEDVVVEDEKHETDAKENVLVSNELKIEEKVVEENVADESKKVEEESKPKDIIEDVKQENEDNQQDMIKEEPKVIDENYDRLDVFDESIEV